MEDEPDVGDVTISLERSLECLDDDEDVPAAAAPPDEDEDEGSF
jgi:hypothetical protein